jgi:D-sedoheptulose 7-phosphate isomerase
MNIYPIQQYFSQVEETLARLPYELIEELISLLQKARLSGRTVFIMGNGGSASTASHFVADLAKNTRKTGWPDFRVHGLTDNMAILTALANDEGYENVFSQQLASLVQPYDIVVAISASGNSPNVLKAVELAHKVKARTIGFTGFDGGKLGPMVDLHIHVPSTIIEQVEDIHLMLEHLVVKTLKELASEPCPLSKDKVVDIGAVPDDSADNSREMYSSLELIQSLVQEVDLQGDVRCSIELVLDTAMKVFGASSGSFLMLNEDGQVTEAALAYGGQVDFKPVSQLADVSTRGLAGWVLENRQAALIQSTREDPRWLPRMWESLGGISRSAVSVPLITDGHVAGVLTLVHAKEGRFTKEDLMLLTTISVFLSVGAARNMKVKS